MKAIDLLSAICVECIDLEQCNTVGGDAVILCGFVPYFGLPLLSGAISADSMYFYMYQSSDWESSQMGSPDIVLGRENNPDRVFLWEIED